MHQNNCVPKGKWWCGRVSFLWMLGNWRTKRGFGFKQDSTWCHLFGWQYSKSREIVEWEGQENIRNKAIWDCETISWGQQKCSKWIHHCIVFLINEEIAQFAHHFRNLSITYNTYTPNVPTPTNHTFHTPYYLPGNQVTSCQVVPIHSPHLVDLEGTLLAIIVDLNVDSWILRERSNADRPVVFEEFLEAFFAFINSFIIQNHHNQLVVSCYGNGRPYGFNYLYHS